MASGGEGLAEGGGGGGGGEGGGGGDGEAEGGGGMLQPMVVRSSEYCASVQSPDGI